jgi:hypothetical protein
VQAQRDKAVEVYSRPEIQPEIAAQPEEPAAESDEPGSEDAATKILRDAGLEAGPETGPEVKEEVEDDTNAANDIRRKLWRMGEALKHIKAKGVELPVDQVGSAICWLAGADKAAGRATFVECFGEAEGGKTWAEGFPEIYGSVNDIYTVAQRLGWRYPIAVNLNRLDRMVEQTEAALMRVQGDIYQAGNELVRPVKVEVQATKGRKTVVAVLVKMDQAFLKTELTKLIDFFNWKGDVRQGAAVPNDVVNGLLGNYGRWRFPVVSGIVTTPTMRRDGSVLMTDDARKESIKEVGKARAALLDRKVGGGGDARDLKAAIMQYTTERLDPKYLGNKLNADRNRIVDGLILRSDYDSHRKLNSWFVEHVNAARDGE